MNKKYVLYSVFLLAAIVIMPTARVSSKLTSPPVGSSGDPATGLTCAQSGCHPMPAHTATSTEVSLTIGTGTPTIPLNSSFSYTPNTVYNIALLINAFVTPNPYYGFQIVALDNANNKAGTMFATNAATTQVNTSIATGTRQYMGHRNASATKNWVFRWTAPAVSTGPVTFYYAINTASASSVPPTVSEGTIYNSSATIQEGPTGIADMANKISSLHIFPNPVNSNFSISFNLKEAENISAQLYSLDGKYCQQLLNEKIAEGSFYNSSDISQIPSGIYLVKLNVGEASVTQKIIKL